MGPRAYAQLPPAADASPSVLYDATHAPTSGPRRRPRRNRRGRGPEARPRPQWQCPDSAVVQRAAKSKTATLCIHTQRSHRVMARAQDPGPRTETETKRPGMTRISCRRVRSIELYCSLYCSLVAAIKPLLNCGTSHTFRHKCGVQPRSGSDTKRVHTHTHTHTH